jgi:hypothetical protein
MTFKRPGFGLNLEIESLLPRINNVYAPLAILALTSIGYISGTSSGTMLKANIHENSYLPV